MRIRRLNDIPRNNNSFLNVNVNYIMPEQRNVCCPWCRGSVAASVAHFGSTRCPPSSEKRKYLARPAKTPASASYRLFEVRSGWFDTEWAGPCFGLPGETF